MDCYAPAGKGLHPIAIIIHGGGYQRGNSKSGSEAYCADFLAPAGYAVFSINYRLAPRYPYPYMVYNVEPAVRYLRHNAAEWNANPRQIALVDGSAGGFLSSIVGLLDAPGDPKLSDPVDRESARPDAVGYVIRPKRLCHGPAEQRCSRLARSFNCQGRREGSAPASLSDHLRSSGSAALPADPGRPG